MGCSFAFYEIAVMIKAGAELITKHLPVWEPKTGKVDMYYWYYASLAMFQVGGSEWTAWNGKMQSAVVDEYGAVGRGPDPIGWRTHRQPRPAWPRRRVVLISGMLAPPCRAADPTPSSSC